MNDDQGPTLPTDVLWARGVRFHLQAVLACVGVVALLSFLGVAAVLMAGPLAKDPPVTAGILALCIGGIAALAGATISGVGQVRTLHAAAQATPTDDAAHTVSALLASTRGGLAVVPRAALAGCIVLIAGYSLWLTAGVWGAVIGSIVVVQVSLGLSLVRQQILSEGRLHRRADS